MFKVTEQSPRNIVECSSAEKFSYDDLSSDFRIEIIIIHILSRLMRGWVHFWSEVCDIRQSAIRH